MKIVYRNLTDLHKYSNNPRTITREQMDRLKESIKKNPDYFEARPLILSDRTGVLVIIAGNQRYEASIELGLTQVPTFLISGLTQEREREIVIRDNVSNGEWDKELLRSWDVDVLTDWGVDLDFGNEICFEPDKTYTKKINAPVYEPSQEVVSVEELCDTRRTDELIRRIDEQEIDEQVKEFLRRAAQRHTVFNFRRIADYYSNATKEIQELMEESALVIIDFDKAIENGYVLLSRAINEQYKSDYDEE